MDWHAILEEASAVRIAEGVKLMDSMASNTGRALAAASDRAIDAAFADEHFEQALRKMKSITADTCSRSGSLTPVES